MGWLRNKINVVIDERLRYFREKFKIEMYEIIDYRIKLHEPSTLSKVRRQIVDLQIMRNEKAKRFPLICTKKDGDVGYDLPATLDEPVTIGPGERKLIPTGIFMEIPKGYWVAIEARSSTSAKSLIVPKGVIDEGYRGEIFAQLMNVGTEPVTINDGDRYVQAIPQTRDTAFIRILEVDELSPSERGSTGFGSTGV